MPHSYRHNRRRPRSEILTKMSQIEYPPGRDDAKVRKVLKYYEEQHEEEAVAEDEATIRIVESAQEGSQ